MNCSFMCPLNTHFHNIPELMVLVLFTYLFSSPLDGEFPRSRDCFLFIVCLFVYFQGLTQRLANKC